MICSRQQFDTLTITATLKIGAWLEIPLCQIQVCQILLWLTSRCGPQFFPILFGVFAIGLKIFFGYSLPVWQSRETIAGPTHNPSPVQHFLVLILIPVPYVWLHIDHADQPLHRPCGPFSAAIDLKLYIYTHFLFLKIHENYLLSGVHPLRWCLPSVFESASHFRYFVGTRVLTLFASLSLNCCRLHDRLEKSSYLTTGIVRVFVHNFEIILKNAIKLLS